jgi:hypothetical protein
MASTDRALILDTSCRSSEVNIKPSADVQIDAHRSRASQHTSHPQRDIHSQCLDKSNIREPQSHIKSLPHLVKNTVAHDWAKQRAEVSYVLILLTMYHCDMRVGPVRELT